jgi:hypothetical protein
MNINKFSISHPDSKLCITFCYIVIYYTKGDDAVRIAIFADGANLYYTQRKYLGWNIDLRKLLEYFDQMGQVVDAYYYSSYDPKDDNQNSSC